MRIIKHIPALKVLAALGAMMLPGFHSYLMAVSSFTIPFSFAMMFDDKVVAKFGVLIVIFLGIYLVVSCISQVLLWVKSSCYNRIGFLCVIALNLCDIICATYSCLDSVSIVKFINILFSVVMVSLSWFQVLTSTSTD